MHFGYEISRADCIVTVINFKIVLSGCGVPPLPPSRSTGLLEYFQMVDGLSLRWSPHVNTQEELSEAVRGKRILRQFQDMSSCYGHTVWK